MRCAGFVLGVLLAPVVGAAGLSTEDVTWINGFADRMASQCVERFARLSDPLGETAGHDGEMLAIERRVNCECLPTRVRVRATPEVVAALRARDVKTAREFMQAQARHCGAQGLRESARPTCLATEQERDFEASHGRKPEAADIPSLPAPDAAMQATCACYAEQVQALDDAALIGEAEASEANFRQRVADTTVPQYEGRLHAILKDCRGRRP